MHYFTIELVGLYINAMIAIAAYLALRSISLTKENGLLNSKRESIKLATEMVGFYLDKAVSKSNEAYRYMKDKGIKIKSPSTRFTKFTYEEMASKEGEKNTQEFIKFYRDIMQNHPQLHKAMLEDRNCMETFAAPFVSKVADNDVAFQSIGKSFCNSVEFYGLFYSAVRRGDGGEYHYYSNTIKLYNIWKSKFELRDLELSRGQIDEEIRSIQINDVRPLGTE
jgi:hypothetical protein